MGYRIRVESYEGSERVYLCKDYQHTNDGLLLQFDDKPDLLLEKAGILRSYIAPSDKNEEHLNIYS